MKLNRWFWGLFLIVAGVLVTLNAMDIVFGITFFKLFVTICLSAIIVQSLLKPSFTGFLIPLAIIAVVFDKELGITSITPWPILITAALVAIGLEMLFNKGSVIKIGYFNTNKDFDEVVDEEDGDNVAYAVNFGSGIKYVNTDSYKKGSFSCNFGAMSIYFDNAKVKGKEAHIHLDVSFGSVELYIPKDWVVENQMSCFLAGAEERPRKTEAKGPKVIITGNVSFGGVEIIYV